MVIIGYAVDAGVRRNKGRTGASEGPTALRRACSNLPCPAQPILLADGGDVVAVGDDVLGAQHELARRVALAQARGARTLVFGVAPGEALPLPVPSVFVIQVFTL